MSDLIDRDEAILALVTIDTTRYCVPCKEVLKAIRELPSVEAQIIACGEDEATDLSNYLDTLWHLAYERGKAEAEPQIIYCKDCKKHNKARGYSYDGTFVGIMDACPLVEIRGKAQGHEFDYQYCVYAKRRE